MFKSRSVIILLTVMICLPAAAEYTSVAELESRPHRSIIKPSIVRLEPGEQQKFKIIYLATYLKAAEAPAPGNVKWSVNNIPGGNKELGTIDADGVYKAPKRRPKPHEVHICAEVEDSVNRYVFATVLIGNPKPFYKLVDTWSEPNDNPPHLKSPHGIALDKDGNLLIADTGRSRVMRFTTKGKYLGDIGLGKGTEPGQVTEPRVVQIDKDGLIFVSDSKGDRARLQVFTNQGKFLYIFAEKGILPGQIHRAHGMGFDRQQRLFVTDVDDFRINVYSHSGQFLYDWGEVGVRPGQLNAPHGLYVDPSGDVFVTGYYGPTQKFDASGNFLFDFAHGDPPDGPVYFHTAVGDKWGNVYLMVRNKEGYAGEVQTGSKGKKISIMKFNNNGDFIAAWSLSEPDHRESWAVVGDDGMVYSLFRGKNEMGVQTFEPQ